jgi:hypothetical protein
MKRVFFWFLLICTETIDRVMQASLRDQASNRWQKNAVRWLKAKKLRFYVIFCLLDAMLLFRDAQALQRAVRATRQAEKRGEMRLHTEAED